MCGPRGCQLCARAWPCLELPLCFLLQAKEKEVLKIEGQARSFEMQVRTPNWLLTGS